MKPERNTYHVYRLFDGSGICLYVGSTTNAAQRIIDHRRRTWGSLIARAEITYHGSSIEANRVERAEIASLRPSKNIDLTITERVGHGGLQCLVMSLLEEHGPMTQLDCFGRLSDLGYDGHPSNASTTLLRLVERGEAEIVGHRPALRGGRNRPARIYAVAERAPITAALDEIGRRSVRQGAA